MTARDSALPDDVDALKAVVRAMATAMERTYGQAPVIYPTMAGTGPMYPVCEALGTPVTSGCGTGYQGTLVHAPNENIEVERFFGGIKTGAALLAYLGAMA